MLSRHGRPQFSNYKGYCFDPILQFERSGNLLFACTSRGNHSWAELTDFIIYQ